MANTIQRGSAGSASNYSRLVTNFGTEVSDAAPLVAKDVFDKVGLLAVLALCTGAVGALARLSPGAMLVAVLFATGFGFAGIFRPAKAAIFAPAYALCIGLALGAISRWYADSPGGGAVVPLAVIGTSGIFVAVLVAYRTGLVKVNHRFLQATLFASVGLLVMMLAVMFGLSIPTTSHATSTWLVFGVAYLVVAVMNLFVDFDYVDRAQAAGVRKEGEWFAALSIMFSLVMVYLALLRLLGRR